MSATVDLLDVNVWLALAVRGHPHHRAALEAWGAMRRPSFCRVTQFGFLRLLCNGKVMGADAFKPTEAWAEYERLLGGGGVLFAAEPAGLEASLKPMLKDAASARDFWTDAYLAAFARSGGMRLVSIDAGFARVKDLESLVLKTAG